MNPCEIEMDRLRRGDESTWRELFRRHYSVMCYVAELYVHDRYLAEALSQDVLSHLWEIREQVQVTSSLRSYLLRSVRNRCLDYFKTNRLASGDLFSVAVPGLFSDDQPLSRILERELEDSLSRAVESLPEETRTVFKKSRQEGLRYNEIAEELGITVNTVKYHMKKALSLLRGEFGKHLQILLLFLFLLH